MIRKTCASLFFLPLIFLSSFVLPANGQQAQPLATSAMKIPEPAQQRGQAGTPPAAASEGPGFVLRDQLTSPAPGHQILGHKRPPVLPRTSVSGLWRTDGGFVARIRIKNALVVAPLEVDPVLYMADGTEYRLPPVTVAVAGVAVININDALAKAPPSVLTHLSTFGSASLTYRYSSGGHLVATTALQDNSRSLALVYPFSESGMVQNQPGSAEGTWEGVWWKHDADVQGFLAVSNVTNREANANIRVVNAAGVVSPPRAIKLAAHSTQMFSLENTNDGLGAEGHAGGVRVDYPGDPGTIMVSGGLLNPKEGYSANIPFARGRSNQIGPVTVGSAGIMVGKPDPMMRFPAETTLTPYLILRNTTTKPINLNLRLNYMAENKPILRELPEKLASMATKRVNLPGVLRSLGIKDLSGSIDVGISYTGQLGDVVMAAGSVDQSGTYVFEVDPQALGSTHRKLGSYWDLEDGSNTMYSLWNPTDKPQDVLVTLYYDNGKYKLPVHLAPQASVMLDIKNIVEANAPDADGNTFPADAREGSASFDSMEGPSGQINLIISGAVFNVVTGTCFGCCVPCCGTTDVFLDPSSDACTLGDSEQFTAMAEQCDGSSFQTGGSWSSSNTSVMTVNSSGLMSTVGSGRATLAFIGNLPANSDCGYPLPGECPPTNFQSSAPVTAAPRIDSIDPDSVMMGSNNVQLTIKGAGFGSSPAVNLPQGVTNLNSGGNSDTTIVITVNVTFNATIGTNTLSVTANNQGSSPADFTIDGPNKLIVQNDVIGLCNGCHTTVERDTTYQVQDFSGSIPNNIQICETPTNTGWNCSQQNPGVNATVCGISSFNLPANGQFTDVWSLNSDALTPAGCGFNITDQWNWLAAPSTFKELGMLTGYIHTNSIGINSSNMPPQANRLPAGTVIPH